MSVAPGLTVILDYGMGNLRSVEKAVQALGGQVVIQDSLAGATRLILPGVGAFGAAMERLAPLADQIQGWAREGRPLLGICLGQQLLFDRSEEMGDHSGLGILPGSVRYFPADLKEGDQTLKVPQMGWNGLTPKQTDGLLTGIQPGDMVYFVHSLHTACEEPDFIAATTDYGICYPSAIQAKNVWAAQFHPEKSGAIGKRILNNFLLTT